MKLTIFTPTYNRAMRLQALYDSIKQSKSFLKNDSYFVEWMIVDDGSTDSTESVIEQLINKNELSIRYFKKENGGKHTAFNLAIEKCDGDLFVCIDDDDKLTPYAIVNMFEIANKYFDNNIGAIVGRVVDVNNNLLGKTVFKDTLVSNTIEIRDKYHFWGEPEVYFVKYLKEYKFDVFNGEKFLTEAYVFDAMSLKYPFLYTNNVMMVKEFLKGGLTDNGLKIRIENAQGAVTYYDLRYWRSTKLTAKFKAAINRRRFNYWNMANKIKYKRTVISFFAVPFAKILYLYDKRKLKK